MRLIWLDRDKIICDDSHVVTIKRKLLYALRTRIDKSQSMYFTWTESEVRDSGVTFTWRFISWSNCSAVEVISSLNEIIIRVRSLYRREFIVISFLASLTYNFSHISSDDIFDDAEIITVKPIGQKNWSHICCLCQPFIRKEIERKYQCHKAQSQVHE